MLRDAIGYLLVAACLPGVAYLLTLTLAAVLPARAPARIALVVPAHDDAQGIGATLANLRDAMAGTCCCDIVVIADNCGGDTAALVAEAGAMVLERHNPARRRRAPVPLPRRGRARLRSRACGVRAGGVVRLESRAAARPRTARAIVRPARQRLRAEPHDA